MSRMAFGVYLLILHRFFVLIFPGNTEAYDG